jgi:hypothetical protein
MNKEKEKPEKKDLAKNLSLLVENSKTLCKQHKLCKNNFSFH